jgi:penicillin-binding protein 1A
MTPSKIIALVFSLVVVIAAVITAYVMLLYSQLPNLITVKDYEPLLVTQVYDRNGNKIGEFDREKRTLTEYKDIPKIVVSSFLAAEDSTFFEHSGINYLANLRAFLVNLKAGEKRQGASTITQQVARSLLLTREKTYTRKIKEILLSYRMESHLTKEEILYLYLNQIFLGQNSYGVAEACKTYFNKELKDITLPEAAILAGVPKAPSEFNPVHNPERAKERQRYVLRRLADDKVITAEMAEKAGAVPIKIYIRKNYWELAPYYLETVRQMLITKLGEEEVLDKGLKVYTSLDLPKQLEAQKQVQQGLRDLDKRQGYRGPLDNTDDTQKMAEILLEARNSLIDKEFEYKTIGVDGKFPENMPLNLSGVDPVTKKPLPNLPSYVPHGEIVKGIVSKVDDQWGLVYVRFSESKGLIDFATMKWARKPDPSKDARWAQDDVKKPSEVLKKGDVILVKIVDDTFSSTRLNDLLKDEKKKDKKSYKRPDDLPEFKDYAAVELEQEPTTEGALLAVDQKTDEIISMVGGYDFNRSKLNRTIQTARQTGSSFKTVVYTAALDKDFTPATPILDAPIVYEEEPDATAANDDDTNQQDADTEKTVKKWRPTNHSNKFVGDILFRNALIRSLNVPSVKILEKVGVPSAVDYARRLGVFSPLNLDFTLALGSSSITLYEMTKMFAEIGRLGKRAKPILVHKVEDRSGKEILGTVYMDEHFSEQLTPIEEDLEKRRQAVLEYQKIIAEGKTYVFNKEKTPAPVGSDAAVQSTTPNRDPSKEPPIFFADPDQLIKPQTAYVMTSLLEGVVDEPGGTGAGARSLGRPVAGKTGTTNSYYDAWFMGYTTDIAAGVWVGYDQENTLGRGEVGGRAALPIWVEYMKAAHEGVPVKNFNVPEGITFASIDNDSGKLASPNSKTIVKQAFIAGSEPKESQDGSEGGNSQDTQEFYKDDLSQ